MLSIMTFWPSVLLCFTIFTKVIYNVYRIYNLIIIFNECILIDDIILFDAICFDMGKTLTCMILY